MLRLKLAFKCSALRIHAVVNISIQAHMDFRYSGDWTGKFKNFIGFLLHFCTIHAISNT